MTKESKKNSNAMKLKKNTKKKSKAFPESDSNKLKPLI